MLENLIKGIIVGLGSSIPLGPLGVLCVQKTLSKGRNSGFITGMGAAVSDTIYAGFALLSLAVIQDFVTANESYVLLFGGFLVSFIGLRIYLTNPIRQIRNKSGNKRLAEDFISGFITTVTNPGALFLILGLFAFTHIGVSTESPKSSISAALWGVLIGSSLWWFVLSTSINVFRSKFRLRQLVMINKIAGIVIIVLSLISMFEGAYKIFF